jgi:hypothetical protein
MESLLGRLNV